MKTAEKTEWKGLWNNRQGVYSGQVIRKADIPNYARLIVRYNRYYEKDSNRPKFVYCFASGPASDAITVQTDRKDYFDLADAETMSEMRCFTDDQLQKLINRIACHVGGDGEYGEHLVSDFVDGYGLETEVK